MMCEACGLWWATTCKRGMHRVCERCFWRRRWIMAQEAAQRAKSKEREAFAKYKKASGGLWLYCNECDGCGWCEGSPAWTCTRCNGKGIVKV